MAATEERAIRVLAQEYLESVRPGVRLDDLGASELFDLLSDGFVTWRDAHPDRELVERQLREQREEEDRIVGGWIAKQRLN